MREDFKKIIEESGVFSIIKEILFDLSAFLNAMNCAITIHSLQNKGSFYMIQKIEKGD